MRVRLQYSSDLEETPSVMSKILRTQADNLKKAALLLDKSLDLIDIDNKYIESSLSLIDDVRKQMNDIDLMLNDCGGILQGYVSVKKQPEITQPPAQQPAPVPQSTRGSWNPETKTYNPPKTDETESE
tara:strand:+ start:1224 stop:1607 length:384 start_codon:yes stop_codon:yes gene_type:complete